MADQQLDHARQSRVELLVAGLVTVTIAVYFLMLLMGAV
jgi:hypothetical protein